MVSSHLHFTKIVLGWVGGTEMWELRIRCSNWGWMCKRHNMFKNWSRGQGGGKIGISDAFLMHFGFSKISKVGDISDISDAFRIFGYRFKKIIKHLLTGGVLGIF